MSESKIGVSPGIYRPSRKTRLGGQSRFEKKDMEEIKLRSSGRLTEDSTDKEKLISRAKLMVANEIDDQFNDLDQRYEVNFDQKLDAYLNDEPFVPIENSLKYQNTTFKKVIKNLDEDT